MITRRGFLKSSGLAMFGAGSVPAWLARTAFAESTSNRRKILVAIFQRGAVDGLNMVVPFGEKRYAELRPTIAIPAPSRAAQEPAVDLDGMFALHPSLTPLKPLYDAQRLAIVQAAGSPDPTRSHFDAQDFMESGTPGVKSTRDGWLDRALPPEERPSPVRAVAIGPALPRTLRGSAGAVAIPSLAAFQVRDKAAEAAFQSMYLSTGDTLLHGTAQETFEAARLLKSIDAQRYTPSNGAAYPPGRLSQSLQQIARLIHSGAGLEVAFTDCGGWDTHVNESAVLSNLLREFGGALAAFAQDLGDRMEDVVVVTMSEFGRTVKENGTRGTDHGHANVMFVLGGPVRGGKVYGDWPGLEQEQLWEGRDLNLTTDFRAVLSELIARHLGRTNLRAVFPGYEQGESRFRNLLG